MSWNFSCPNKVMCMVQRRGEKRTGIGAYPTIVTFAMSEPHVMWLFITLYLKRSHGCEDKVGMSRWAFKDQMTA